MRTAWNNAAIEIACYTCGRPFSVSPSKASKRKHCSRECKFQQKRVETRCAACGTQLRAKLYRAHNHKNLFCSLQCRFNFQKRRQRILCCFCFRPFEKKLSQLKRSALHFCTHSCSENYFTQFNHPGFKGGMNYGREWNSIAKAIRARDGVCQKCGKTPEKNGRELDVHHIRPFAFFGYANRLEAHKDTNLQALCRSCHKEQEEALCN